LTGVLLPLAHAAAAIAANETATMATRIEILWRMLASF
jgi:hypothetical protein